MCTLIVAWRVFEETPVCVAANRDERFARPASPPAVREGDPRILAPRDEQAGGTWLGYNDAGVLVAITNRWEHGDGERSRGLLVDDALSAQTAADAVAGVRKELEEREYAPFHLLVADDEDCLYVENRGSETGDGHDVFALGPSIHIVVNVGFDGEWFVPAARPETGRKQAGNAEDIRTELQPRDGETADDWTRRAGDILSDHDYGACIHRNGFGTRSSALVRLGEDRIFEFADGPPCRTPYERVEDSL